MVSVYLISSILLGFTGSFHCVGMCGPLALMLPVQQYSGWRRVFAVAGYNAGRMMSYAALGVLFGLLGSAFVFSGYQQFLSVCLGLLLLLTLFVSGNFSIFSNVALFKWLRKQLSVLISNGSGSSLLLIGVLNGLLPCGFVYMGLAGATATGTWYHGALFMAGFGLGTVPAMFALSWFGHLLPPTSRKVLRKASPVLVGVMALFLILRGLNLGIPYLSPKLSSPSRPSTCCHK